MSTLKATEGKSKRDEAVDGVGLLRHPQALPEDGVVSSYCRRPLIWRDVTPQEWSSYAWQWAHRLSTVKMLDAAIALTPLEREAIVTMEGIFPAVVSPHYVSLIRQDLGEACPIRRQAIPSVRELERHEGLLDDPLGEVRHSYAACATRRYPDRTLIYAAHACAMRCRHCTRRTKVGGACAPTLEQIRATLSEIGLDARVRDVLVSGGDPLSLPNAILGEILKTLRGVAHVDVIRLCTRMPCTLPQRFNDPELLAILRETAPIYVSVQFNHDSEASLESARALTLLREAGCILSNQSVLLRGVNDVPETFERLYRWLLRHGCRPYYLFQCDAAQGTRHFMTPISRGLEIMDFLRGRLSGLGIPHYVIDLPDGMGKVELCPDYVVGGERGGKMKFRNWCGDVAVYDDGV